MCRSVFASTMIEALSSTTSPLLDADQNFNLCDKVVLQPDSPTEQQTHTYNAFSQSVLDTCQNSNTRLGEFQNFRFSAQNDEWTFSRTGRTGIPLADFRERWDQPKPYPYTGPINMKTLTFVASAFVFQIKPRLVGYKPRMERLLSMI